MEIHCLILASCLSHSGSVRGPRYSRRVRAAPSEPPWEFRRQLAKRIAHNDAGDGRCVIINYGAQGQISKNLRSGESLAAELA